MDEVHIHSSFKYTFPLDFSDFSIRTSADLLVHGSVVVVAELLSTVLFSKLLLICQAF
jgi:hypothetical protein